MHLNELTESDFDLLERSNSKFHDRALSAKSRLFWPHPFAFDRLRSLGFNVCLGTDSLASNQTLSLFDEMRHFQKNFPQISPKEIFRLVTVNPARALRYENALGQIRPGFRADLIAVPSPVQRMSSSKSSPSMHRLARHGERAGGPRLVGRVTPCAPLPNENKRRAEDCPPYQRAVGTTE